MGKYPYGDRDHSESTARLNGVLPDEVNYMVIPTDYEDYKKLMGCVGMIINNETGKYVYAVVCEGGPKENGGSYGACAWDEVSINAAWEINGIERGRLIANTRQYGNYSFIIFRDSKRSWKIDDTLQHQIDMAGVLR